jgi:uroporphyrin-III C-methyltransferase
VTGKVYLVGAGPGDHDLLTLKALRLLRSADVVLHDALVSDEILELALPHARLIDVSKRVGHRRYTQAEINRQMIESAQWANVVVRLKGGDPLIFGRAAEEMATLRQARVEFEVVPGITAATAAAAQARIPLTDRESASCVTLVTAHVAAGKPAVDFASVAATGSTVAIYMPGSSYGHISRQMIAAGMAPETCCLLVSNACRKNQQLQWTDLRSLRSITPAESPALLIVGEVARCRDESAASTLLQSHDGIVQAISHVAPE